ncbi:hypothetical protein Ancab_018885 [Ancistrocladus abbreviatus]
MRFHFQITSNNIAVILFLQLLLLLPSSAHFFQDPANIPSSFNASHGAWDNFRNFGSCRIGEKVDGLAKLKRYLQCFGYIDPNARFNFTDDFDISLESAIRTYQQNFHLNVTGELDDQTLLHVIRPRCGVPDIINGTNNMVNNNSFSTHKRPLHIVSHYTFFKNSPHWPLSKYNLTYAFLPENQLSDTAKRVFSRAFDRWAAVTPLTFTEAESYTAADLKIAFYSGDHGDGEPFDGVMGALAHAFSPPSGWFHLDNDETGVVSGDVGKSSVETAVDLESVVVHEIGHLLGLGHSAVEEAILYPTIPARTRKVELTADDIEGIQVLYGGNPNYNASDNESVDVNHGGRPCGGVLSRWSLVVLSAGVFGILI